MTYGYADVLDDGRAVVSQFGQPTIYFGDRAVSIAASVGTWLDTLRATIGPDGKAYAVGQGNADGRAWLVCEDGRTVNLAATYGVSCGALTSFGASLLVTVQTRGDEATIFTIDPTDLTLLASQSMPIPGTSQGFQNVGRFGEPVLIDPIFRQLAGRTVGFVNTVGGLTIAQDTETGYPVISDGVTIGPLAIGAAFEPHLSPNGKFWICRSDAPVMLSGRVPDEIPPFPVVREAIPNIGRPCWLAWFEFNGQATDAPHNARLVVPTTLTDPMYVTALDGKRLHRWVSAASDSDIDELEAAIARVQAAEPAIQALAYLTRKGATVRIPRGTPHVAVEAYWGIDESAAAFEARLRATCTRCVKPWLVAQVHTSNATLITDVAKVVPIVARVARDIPSVQGILGFSGAGRPKGWQDQSADVHDPWRALFHGITKAPEIVVTSPPPVTPPVTPPQPIPAPAPVPTPIPEENEDMEFPKVGGKGAYRELGSTATPTNATLVECQDDGFLSLVDGYGLVQFNTDTGKVSGHKPGVNVGTGAERIKFQTANVFVCRAGDMNNGPLLPYEWYGR